VYLYFRVDVRPELERAGHWHVLGFFDLKEHFAAIGLALLPAYLVCWRRPHADEPSQTRTALTSILAFITPGLVAGEELGGCASAMVGVVAALLAGRWTQAIWPGWIWVIPALSMIACVYLTLPWFRF
jgi:hypothetical protein